MWGTTKQPSKITPLEARKGARRHPQGPAELRGRWATGRSAASNYTALTLQLSCSARLTNEIRKHWVLNTGIWHPFISWCLTFWYVPLREGPICNIKINFLHKNGETGLLSQLFRYSWWTTCYGHLSPCTVENLHITFDSPKTTFDQKSHQQHEQSVNIHFVYLYTLYTVFLQ